MAALQFGRGSLKTRIGGENASLGDWDFGAGGYVAVLRARADEAASEMGRVDGGGVSAGDWESAGDLPAAFRNIGEAWAAFAIGNRLAECAVRGGARGSAGVCGDFSRILFRADCGSAA